jgi:hypothetical protein
MLKHKDGYVLKPIEKPRYGEREIKFYEDLQSATDNVSVGLRKFVPKYLGSTTLRINEKGENFLYCLYFSPCVQCLLLPHCAIFFSKGAQIKLVHYPTSKLQLLQQFLIIAM